jgi:hypothetical protein
LGRSGGTVLVCHRFLNHVKFLFFKTKKQKRSMSTLQKLLTWLLPIFLLPTLIAAQTSTIRGTVLDQQSEIPLVGVTLRLVAATPDAPTGGAVSDASGFFEIKNVPVGRREVVVTYPGYEPATLSNILVTAGKEVQLNVRLQESFSSLREVTITAAVDKDKAINELATISARQFNTEEVMRYSGGRNDVAKLVANFAGVAANNDARNDIVIRGNSPTGVLWRLEGVPIPNPNHFSTLGTTGGPVSALNPNLIGNSDFLTGAFPAEYGNALAGVFDINLRTGNKEKLEFTTQIGAFSGFEALVEGPLNKRKNGSFVVAYRHSFVELASAAGLQIGTNAVPRYRDLSFNADFGQTKAGRFSVFGIGGRSNINFLAAEVDTTDLFADPNENAYNVSYFGVLGLKHNLLLNDRAYIRTVVSTSYSSVSFESENIGLVPEGGPIYQATDVQDGLTAVRVSSFYNQKINQRITLRTGVLWQNQRLDTYVNTRDRQPDRDGDGIPDWIVLRDFAGDFNTFEAYAQTQTRLTERLLLNVGLHSQYFGPGGSTPGNIASDWAVEPRVALNWRFSPRQSLNLGYGLHHQAQPLPVFFIRQQLADGSYVANNERLGFTRNQHFVLGYDFKPAPDWHLKAETYYQLLSNVPVDRLPSSFSILNAGADFVFPDKPDLVNAGTGTNVGLELTAEKFFSRGYYGMVTVSVFDSRYKGSDGVERQTAFNGRYVANALAGREFKIGSSGRRFLTIDTKLTTANGRPYTPVNLPASQFLGYEVLENDKAFSLRMDDYFRWDVKFGFRINSAKRKFSQTFFFDFQNVTNNDNIFAMQYNPNYGTVGRVNQIGFLPDFLWRMEF